MHHPEIHDILITIQDLLLLSGDPSNCQIVPASYYFEDEYENKQRARGFHLLRKLSSGWLKVQVMDLYDDTNTVTFEYLSSPDDRDAIKTTVIECEEYSLDRVQDAVREIVIMDKKTGKQLATANA